MKRHRTLGDGFDRLEARDLPTVFGIPWADPGHLTLSFVPDGTPTPTGPSTLFRTLDAVAPRAVWQREVLRAFETWAVRSNVDVGLVADGGQPLGTPGAVQGDARFGDIRIAAAPLGEGELAAASPFSWTGTTFSGDVVFDATEAFQIGDTPTGYDLYSVALHEAGHAFGLGHSADPASAIQENYVFRTGLGAGDVRNVQALYGARAADSFDAARANDTPAAATAVPGDPLLATRRTAVGDLTTAADVDYFKFTVPPLVGLPGVSVRLTAAGDSLLAAGVTVYDAAGRVVASAASVDPTKNDLAVRFGASLLGGTYTVKVDGAADDFAVGGYQLTVDYLSVGGVLAPVTNLLAPVTDGHSNDVLGLATVLAPLARPAPDARFDYTYRGVIEDRTDTDTYRVNAPAAGTLNVLAWGLDAAPLNPRVQVFDAAGTPVAFQVLANDTGLFSIQVPGVAAGGYLIRVAARSPGGSNGTGGYFLGADFNALTPTTFAAVGGEDVAPGAPATGTLGIGRDGLFVFALAPEALAAGGGAVTLTVFDATGKAVFTLSATAGQPPVTTAQYLAAGTYTLRYTAAAADGRAAGPVRANLFLLKLSDGVGPYATTTNSSAPPPSSAGSSSPSGGSSSAPPPSGGSAATASSGGSGYTYAGSSNAQPTAYGYSY